MLQAYDQSHQSPLLYGPATTMTPTKRPNTSIPNLNHHHIFIVTGPAGCGKSTVAKFLADQFSLCYVEGDEVSLGTHITQTKPNIQVVPSRLQH
jgi:gluconokinase